MFANRPGQGHAAVVAQRLVEVDEQIFKGENVPGLFATAEFFRRPGMKLGAQSCTKLGGAIDEILADAKDGILGKDRTFSQPLVRDDFGRKELNAVKLSRARAFAGRDLFQILQHPRQQSGVLVDPFRPTGLAKKARIPSAHFGQALRTPPSASSTFNAAAAELRKSLGRMVRVGFFASSSRSLSSFFGVILPWMARNTPNESLE